MIFVAPLSNFSRW